MGKFRAAALAALILAVSLAVPSAASASLRLEAAAGPAKINLTWAASLSGVQEWQVYRGTAADFIPGPDNLLATLPPEAASFTDAALSPGTLYYYLVRAVLADGYVESNVAGAVVRPPAPHGGYPASPVVCATCHTAHTAAAASLLAEAEPGLCYRCHKAGGESTYDVQAEFARPGSRHDLGPDLACSSCHDAHRADLPRLLQVTVSGAVYHEGGGNAFCLGKCHPSVGTYYPPPGSGHNGAGLTPPQTGIACSGCHEPHGAELPKLLATKPAGASRAAAGNDPSFCYACHGTDAFPAPHRECLACHDPHGTPFAAYLKRSYDFEDENRAEPFRESDFATCLTEGCHTAAEITGSTSGFYDAASGRNLHAYHLNNTSAGSAVCKECHRPHGALPEENPGLKSLVGFPAATVTARVYEGQSFGPEFLSTDGGGGCNLACHGAQHAVEPGPGEISSSYRR